MKQMHQKDREDQEEELEDVRQSCQKRVCDQQVELCPWALAGPVLMPSSLEWGMSGGWIPGLGDRPFLQSPMT